MKFGAQWPVGCCAFLLLRERGMFTTKSTEEKEGDSSPRLLECWDYDYDQEDGEIISGVVDCNCLAGWGGQDREHEYSSCFGK